MVIDVPDLWGDYVYLHSLELWELVVRTAYRARDECGVYCKIFFFYFCVRVCGL